MAITFVQGSAPLEGGGDTGSVFIGWNGEDTPLSGMSTADSPPVGTGSGSNRIATVQYVRQAITQFGGGGPGGTEIHFGDSPPPTPHTAGQLWLLESSARLLAFYPQTGPAAPGVWIEVGGGGPAAIIINSAVSAAPTPTPVHDGFTEVNGPSGGGGVRWTSAAMGAQCMVRNAIPAGIIVSFYPPTGGSPPWTVNGQASFTIGADVTATFLCLGGNRIVSVNP
jgi:hypothetical protein